MYINILTNIIISIKYDNYYIYNKNNNVYYFYFTIYKKGTKTETQ